ncbi:unnamed protein product [Mytilus coruscus]|uniref:Uncharacterized protein n=1 Tax=Mytilus coruscus TaxID=42192 RepID=A0A6J8C3R8_MYTCO|nr:unnamed protein product [Mytilus coruscus]
MADAMLNKEKVDKTSKSSFEDDLLLLDEDELAYEEKGKGPAKRKCSKTSIGKSSTGSGSKVNNKDAKGKTVVNKGYGLSASTSDSNNNVIINMLTDMRNEQSSTNKRLEDMNKRIDVLYNDDCYDEEYDCEGEVDEDVDEVHEAADDVHDTDTNEQPKSLGTRDRNIRQLTIQDTVNSDEFEDDVEIRKVSGKRYVTEERLTKFERGMKESITQSITQKVGRNSKKHINDVRRKKSRQFFLINKEEITATTCKTESDQDMKKVLEHKKLRTKDTMMDWRKRKKRPEENTEEKDRKRRTINRYQ